MISSDMYKVLKGIPRSPIKTSYLKLLDTKKFNADLLHDMLEEAINNGYIAYTEKEQYYMVTTSYFCIAEAGKIAIEEYKRQKNLSVKATWALIIAGLSFIASVVAIIASMI